MLLGLAGNDYLDGGTGSDTLWGGTGNDLLSGGAGADQLLDEEGSDTLGGGSGNDGLIGQSGDNLLDGGEGDDYLIDGAGNDTLDGGAGDDQIDTGSQQSPSLRTVQILGGSGNDIIFLGDNVATKRVEISGGSGSDIFRFDSGQHAETNVINDFQAGIGGDRLHVYGAPSGPGHPFGAAGYLRLLQSGSHTLLQFDEDGAAGQVAQFHMLAILHGIAATVSDDQGLQPGPGWRPH